MKQVIIIATVLLLPLGVNASHDRTLQEIADIPLGVIGIPAVILALYLILTFILTFAKSIMDNRLKARMIEKGVSDKVVEQLLHPDDKDVKGQAMKSFLLLTGIGVGLTIIYFFLPIGIHSIAIMSFSIALSFLAYYYFLSRSEK
jgi:cobalamin synthase